MALHERRDEDLILDGELSQLRQLELALDRDAAVCQAESLIKSTLITPMKSRFYRDILQMPAQGAVPSPDQPGG
ncbi:hypothetical protein ACFQYP_32225 [Nonomuraea antimicrobica]|uniref:hypothetical protein n=1 Tax=Nonomuraea antimicrobica TaxID=561173 RepID=UPI0031ED59DF